jgi:hypothetical protein
VSAEPYPDPARPRSVIDYQMQARAAIAGVGRRGGPIGMHQLNDADDLRDADPYLRKAAKFHGSKVDRLCPLCSEPRLVELSYVFGRELGPFSGRIKHQNEISEMAYNHGEFRVFVVEVCRECDWNHLSRSYVLGDGVPRKPLRKPRDWID